MPPRKRKAKVAVELSTVEEDDSLPVKQEDVNSTLLNKKLSEIDRQGAAQLLQCCQTALFPHSQPPLLHACMQFKPNAKTSCQPQETLPLRFVQGLRGSWENLEKRWVTDC